ncbi:hypothetical protein BV22DRAFT_1027334 [Leucogyrophana mollusca]|uniref:Uncharacterized protein n=1 Tax=Leucogyrophana mollusca TaxID=85980 RepID=A0ACB8AU84_9AGAM|nr:hypothetical protein BV22DRAFT_1027334 [Leucogyrophana mollusca]
MEAWEPESHLENAWEAVRDFYQARPSAPRKLRGISTELFASMFKAAPDSLTESCPIWSCLEVEP